MGLSNEHFYEAVSFSHLHNPHRFFQSEVLRLYFPALEPWVAQSVLIPSCSYQFICTQMAYCAVIQLLPRLVRHPLLFRESSLLCLPVSAPPTGLDECFFFNSLVVGLPYSLISCQFWLFFVFKFVVVLF